MATFVHITTEKNVKSILENGIKTKLTGKEVKGVYCMAVTRNFVISHQWLRELKRDGQKTKVGAYFKLNSDEKVLFGHYKQSHVEITAGEAVKAVMDAPDARGFEIIIPRSISPKEIYKVKHLPQVIGWRYYPEAHGKSLCLCPACNGLRKGKINSTKLLEDKYNKLLAKLRTEKDELEIMNLIEEISELIYVIPNHLKKVDDFAFLVDHPSERVKECLASVLTGFKNEKAVTYLLRLLESQDEEVRGVSANGILCIKGTDGLQYLENYKDDAAVSVIINDYLELYEDEE